MFKRHNMSSCLSLSLPLCEWCAWALPPVCSCPLSSFQLFRGGEDVTWKSLYIHVLLMWSQFIIFFHPLYVEGLLLLRFLVVHSTNMKWHLTVAGHFGSVQPQKRSIVPPPSVIWNVFVFMKCCCALWNVAFSEMWFRFPKCWVFFFFTLTKYCGVLWNVFLFLKCSGPPKCRLSRNVVLFPEMFWLFLENYCVL